MKKITFILLAALITLEGLAQNTFRYRTENATLYLLSEGQREGGLGILLGATPGMIARIGEKYPSATNAFLIRTDDGKNILLDTGYGRELFKNLKAIGVAPEDIHAVAITHLHGDHTGGLLLDGKCAFPNARLLISKAEAESASDAVKTILATYELTLFEPTDAPVAVWGSLKAMACYGHTPGHTLYLIDRVAIWGDLTHAMAYQMPHPQVAVTYDRDPVQAVASRLKMLTYLSDNGYVVAGMHVAYPGIGTIRPDGEEGYVFTSLPLQRD